MGVEHTADPERAASQIRDLPIAVYDTTPLPVEPKGR